MTTTEDSETALPGFTVSAAPTVIGTTRPGPQGQHFEVTRLRNFITIRRVGGHESTRRRGRIFIHHEDLGQVIALLQQAMKSGPTCSPGMEAELDRVLGPLDDLEEAT